MALYSIPWEPSVLHTMAAIAHMVTPLSTGAAVLAFETLSSIFIFGLEGNLGLVGIDCRREFVLMRVTLGVQLGITLKIEWLEP